MKRSDHYPILCQKGNQIMFVATSLILVAAIVTVAMSNAVYATPPKTLQYYLKDKSGFGSCAPDKDSCEALVKIGKAHCVRVLSK